MKFSDFVKNSQEPLVAPLLGFPGIVLTSSTLAQNLHDGKLQAETLIALNTQVDFDIIFPMMDLTVEAEALGGHIDWETDEMPTIKGTSVETVEDINAIVIPEIGKDNRLNVFVETCKFLKEAFPNKQVWAYVLGPYSIAGRLMGMTEISIALKLEPETVHTLLSKVSELLIKYINGLLETGVDGLMILEPASGMLRMDDANEFSNAYVKKMVEIIKNRDKVAALHNCGNIDHLIESLCATGIDVLHVGSVSDPIAIYPRLPKAVVLMGNLDPTEVLLRSTPEGVAKATKKLSDKMADEIRFIISSGCDVPPGVSLENIKAFERAAKHRNLNNLDEISEFAK